MTEPAFTGAVGVARGVRVRRFARPHVVVALIILVGLAVVAAFAPLFAPYNPYTQNVADSLQPPFWAAGGSLSHPLGTDELGRDLLSRLMYGGRTALALSFAASLTSAVVGVTLGLVAGVGWRWSRSVIMWLVDAQLGFPYVILALAIVTVKGASFVVLFITLSIFGWVQFARVVRGEVLSVKKREYITAARSSGASAARVVTHHILPNIMSPVIVLWTFSLATVLLIESGLSFLGAGVQPPNADWGLLLETGRAYLYQDVWYSLFPGAAILITVLCVNVVGISVRDALNPRSRGV